MQISFFEEFPTKENLSKIEFVTFPTKLYIGAKSLQEFNSIKLKSKFVKKKIYWPILEKRDGYWLSPFTRKSALAKMLKELEGKKTPIMWDAELPTRHNPLLYLTQLPNFISNRKKIRKFLATHKEIYTAEYFPSSKQAESLLHFLGLNFRTKNHYPIKMIYSSMHNFGEKRIRKEIKQAKKHYGNKLLVAFGTLTHGVLGTEPAIKPKTLKRDLQIAKELNIKEVILFRLGGMNKEYAKVLSQFQ